MFDDLIQPRFVSVALSRHPDAATAVAEIAAQLTLDEACFALAFVPSRLDTEALAAAMRQHLGGLSVFGCTSPGQITPQGYEDDALMFVVFPRRHFRCSSLLIEGIKPLQMKKISDDLSRLKTNFQHTAGWKRLALVLCDGIAKSEDLLASTLQVCLGETPLYGGSAGDGLEFRCTLVFHGGRFHETAAVVLLIETSLDFEGIAFDHFLPTSQLLVVTQAKPEERRVYELNGAPAAQEYARCIGRPAEALSPEVFAENPVLVRQNLNHYVRAIKTVDADQSLTFMGAIDDGLVLTLGRGCEIIETLEKGLDVVGPNGTPPDFILGFDCILRKLEFDQKDMSNAVSSVLKRHKVLGFNTYGEQHCGVHVNQTFVGVAFFERKPEDLH